jgi:hypothetical protein
LNKREFKKLFYQDVLKINKESVEEAEKKGHVNKQKAELIWKYIQKGYAYILIPGWLLKKVLKSYYTKETSEYICQILDETEKAVKVSGFKLQKKPHLARLVDKLILDEDVQLKNVWLPKSQIKLIKS